MPAKPDNKALRGINTFRLNDATMNKVVEQWINTKLFMSERVTVTSVTYNNHAFDVKTQSAALGNGATPPDP